MLQRSPYKDKLADAGLFLRMVSARAKQLPNLIQPHIGDHIAEGDGQLPRLNDLMKLAPELSMERLDQTAALALGARLVLDPWSGRLELLRMATQPTSLREKVPLAVTPLTPFLKYAPDGTPAPASAPANSPAPPGVVPAPQAAQAPQ